MHFFGGRKCRQFLEDGVKVVQFWLRLHNPADLTGLPNLA